MRNFHSTFWACLTAVTCLTAAGTAMAQTAPAAPPPGYWIGDIHLYGQIQGGITYNPASPKLNIGHSFTDRANTPLLNQVLLGAEKKLDPKATGFDWGFKLAAFHGSDARYTHYLGFLDQDIPKQQRNQIDVTDASLSLHIPVSIFEGGLDLKAGLYATPLGAELIDPATNPFYSHSYIFNYALPFKHTGAIATVHATGFLDLYLGVDTGTNTTFGSQGENNKSVAGILGVGLNLMGGDLTVLALSHFGPENAQRALAPVFNANNYMRYFNDIVVVWKATDKLTLTAEGTWAMDEFGGIATKGKPAPANAFGLAGYGSYALTDTITLNARAELFRDDNGFFVGAFPGNYDPVYAQKGSPLSGAIGVPAATYGSLTLGVTYKPGLPKAITSLAIRPEFRVDQSLGGNNVFNRKFNKTTGTFTYRDTTSITIGADVVLTF
ncbi:MAG: porin [Acetobacteraceae bacterium]|nr:porin [Acetobacteraceae bacterium]